MPSNPVLIAPIRYLLFILSLAPMTVAGSVDMVLAMDHSLSMNQTDPARDSLDGAALFTDLLQPRDRLSLIAFAQDARTLLPLQSLDDRTERQHAIDTIHQIEMNGVRTDFGAALRSAYEHLSASNHAPDATRILVLFSDGQLNLGSEVATQRARDEIIRDLIPRFQRAGIQIYGISFSPEGDVNFLRLLTDSTGGQTLCAERPADIYAAFIKLFEQADQPLTAPVIDGRVEVDANVRELKLLIQRNPGDAPTTLTDPSQRELTAASKNEGVTWGSTEHFDRITIRSPEAGSWRISGDNQDKRAYLESDLDLDARLPVLATAGEPVTVSARLVYHGGAVDEQLASKTGFTAKVVDTTGTAQPPVQLLPDMSAQQATRRHLGQIRFTAPGAYQVVVAAESESFQRTKILSMSALPAEQMPTRGFFDSDRGSALLILISGNLALLVLAATLGGLWWARRRRQTAARRDTHDNDETRR